MKQRKYKRAVQCRGCSPLSWENKIVSEKTRVIIPIIHILTIFCPRVMVYMLDSERKDGYAETDDSYLCRRI